MTKPVSARATGKAIRKSRTILKDSAGGKQIESVSQSVAQQNEEDDAFGQYVAMTMRQLQPPFAGRLKTAIQLQIAQIGLEAAKCMERRQQCRPENAVTVRMAHMPGEQYTEVFAFGADDTPYASSIHNSMYAIDSLGNIVRDRIVLQQLQQTLDFSRTNPIDIE